MPVGLEIVIVISIGLMAFMWLIVLPVGLFAAINLQLGYRNPQRYIGVKEQDESWWWLKTRRFEGVANELKQHGFTEIGAKVGRHGFMRMSLRAFYSPDLHAYATLSSRFLKPVVGLTTGLPDGTIVTSTTSARVRWRGSAAIQEYVASGPLTTRLQQHRDQIALAGGESVWSEFVDSGSMADLLALDRREIAIRYIADDTVNLHPLEKVPSSVICTVEHHGIAVLLRANQKLPPSWPWFLVAVAYALSAWAGSHPLLDLAFLLSFVFVVPWAFLTAKRSIWPSQETLSVHVSHERLRIGPEEFRLADATTSVIDDDLVVTATANDVPNEHRFGGFGTQQELRWLLDVIESARREQLLPDDIESSDVPQELERLMGRAQTAPRAKQ